VMIEMMSRFGLLTPTETFAPKCHSLLFFP
jgi:hypothetical protein